MKQLITGSCIACVGKGTGVISAEGPQQVHSFLVTRSALRGSKSPASASFHLVPAEVTVTTGCSLLHHGACE